MNLLAQTVDVPPDVLSALLDALANRSWIVAAIVGVLLLVPIVLKAFKVNVPLLDPIVEILLKVVKSFAKKPAAPSEPAKPAEGVDEVAEVHDINELKGPKV